MTTTGLEMRREHRGSAGSWIGPGEFLIEGDDAILNHGASGHPQPTGRPFTGLYTVTSGDRFWVPTVALAARMVVGIAIDPSAVLGAQ